MKPLILCVCALAVACGGETAVEDRHTEVARAGAAVMPFDLDRTTHIFETTERGGLQQVLSDDGDPEQIRSIREHLSDEVLRHKIVRLEE